MRFTVKTANLREAIAKVERVVSKQTTLPILGNILISTENGRMAVSATNLEIAIKTYVGAKIEEEGNLTVPARIINGFLGTIKDDVIEGTKIDDDLEITSENHKIRIKGIDAKDFPIIPEMPKQSFFNLNAVDFTKAAASVLVSVAHNDTRQELNGVFIKLEEDSLVMAATDSFRLSEAIVGLDKKSISEEYRLFMDKNPSIIIPGLTLAELQRIAGTEELSFTVDQNQLFIKSNSVKLISRLINGNYPEYRQILPQSFDVTVMIDKEQLVNAIKIASLVASNQNGEVHLSSSEDKKSVIVSSQSIDTGENISTIPAEIDGPGFEVIFNCRYILDGLGIALLDSSKVFLKLNQQKSPVILKAVDDKVKEKDGFSYVIMPIIKG